MTDIETVVMYIVFGILAVRAGLWGARATQPRPAKDRLSTIGEFVETGESRE